MASFRTGFKIFGEISLKQGLGRIRSFSEDRKPGHWLPEDQWAVRQPGSTCPDPCEKPKKPPKPSKSWLSVCKDPETPIECDVRHSNCPPPPVKEETPWYSLDNLIPKKKSEKIPPLQSCREEMKRRELLGEEEVGENNVDKTFAVHLKPELPESCMPKREPCPAPVVTISCPLPKELDIMLWCGRPSTDSSKITALCQSDRLPYHEFRPQKCWKPPPFSLPVKGDPTAFSSPCQTAAIAFAEFKNVEVPRHLYTRYKSVELSNSNLLFCMTEVKCPDDQTTGCIEIKSPPPPPPPPPLRQQNKPSEPEEKFDACPEKPVIEAASCKPVRIKKAPKYAFRPKPTKLIEKRVFRNPCAQHKICNLQFRPPEEKSSCPPAKNYSDCEPPKVITGTLTNEPQTFERSLTSTCNPPKWMYTLCKPGAKDTPLMPTPSDCPKEPDCSSETDGLKFYDGKDEGITPKPGPDPCLKKPVKIEPISSPETPAPVEPCLLPVPEFRNRFVLMPEKYNIKKMRFEEPSTVSSESYTFEKFIEAKTATTKKSSKSYPQMKENILYDLQRLCPNLPLDPSKLNAPCRKPPEPECPRPPTFRRGFSTLSPSTLEKLCSNQLCKIPHRTECGDTSGKCKARKLVPKPKDCPEEKPKPTCAEIALPCCSKARLPPACDARKPMPVCKKKLPPKPSFSECSKDPPPCPKMTECNCWENVGGKNRKFSDWAAKRAGGQDSPGKPGQDIQSGLALTFGDLVPRTVDFPDGIYGIKICEQKNLTNLSVTLANTDVTYCRNRRSSKFLDSNARSQYAGKVKCYTLKAAHSSANAAGNRTMLGLKDPKVDSLCDYEQRSIVTDRKQKKTRTGISRRDYSGNASFKSKRMPEPLSDVSVQDREFTNKASNLMAYPENDFKGSSLMIEQEQDFKSEPENRVREIKERENSVTLHTSEQDEENSKDFMGSIGSWINDLFSAPNKRPCAAPPAEKEEVQKECSLEGDAEYLNSICAIKEQFRKKLKSETSVHLSTADRPFEFNFDKVLDNSKKTKKRVRSLPSPSSVPLELDVFNDYESLDPVTEPAEKLTRRHSLIITGTGLSIRTNDKETESPPAKETVILNSSNLIKEKRRFTGRSRSEVNKLEEYVLPSPADLSKRILLNINDQEKCLQFYKNPHLGVQDPQHYGPRKSKPCQSNTRCYTTNANVKNSPEQIHSKTFMTLNRHSHYFTTGTTRIKGEENILEDQSPIIFRKPPFRKVGKTISELSRDTLSFVKAKPPKTGLSLPAESVKTDPKATSDELVKYLMKKIKVSSRPQPTKKKGINNIPQILANPKTRFMQSATNSLVMSVIAKKESDLQAPVKTRVPTDNKLMKSTFLGKELTVKYPAGGIRFDVSRAINSNKFNKSTYLLEDDKPEDDPAFFGKNSYRNTRRPYEDLLKKDTKKNIDKYTKRQEVKNMLSRLDMKFNVLQSSKSKQREQKKKVVKTINDSDLNELKEAPNPRFLKQHELFKNNIKPIQQNTESVSEVSEKQADSSNSTSPSTELALVNTDSQLTLANLQEKHVVIADQPEQSSSDITRDDSKIADFSPLEENLNDLKNEKKPLAVKTTLCKEKSNKMKSKILLKESDGKCTLSSLADYYTPEQQNLKETSKPCEPSICPTDLRSIKPSDMLLFNRRYSTNILTEMNQKCKAVPWTYQPQKCEYLLTELGKDNEKGKKEAKDKKKGKNPSKNSGTQDNNLENICGFEKIKKKPGPNCEADDASTS